MKNTHEILVALLDVDRMADYNSTWGYRAGDELLELVETTLRSYFGRGANVRRLDADEFIVHTSSAREADFTTQAYRLEICSSLPVSLTAGLGSGVDEMHALENARNDLFARKRYKALNNGEIRQQNGDRRI